MSIKAEHNEKSIAPQLRISGVELYKSEVTTGYSSHSTIEPHPEATDVDIPSAILCKLKTIPFIKQFIKVVADLIEYIYHLCSSPKEDSNQDVETKMERYNEQQQSVRETIQAARGADDKELVINYLLTLTESQRTQLYEKLAQLEPIAFENEPGGVQPISPRECGQIAFEQNPLSEHVEMALLEVFSKSS